MKKIFLTTIFLLQLLFLFSDNSNDLVRKSPFQLRGDLSYGMSYHFDFHRGMSTNHLARVNYSPIDYTSKDDIHHSSGQKGRIVGDVDSVKLGIFFNYAVIFPFFTDRGPLFQRNSVAFSFKSELNPISFMAGFDITVTPIAFLKFSTGFAFGSGWSFFGLSNGLGRNVMGKILTEPFYGPVFRLYLSGTFQFDLAALMRENLKRWLHIVLQAVPKLEYFALLNNKLLTPFQWQGDFGENFNGLRFYYTLLLGYQIPVLDPPSPSKSLFLKRDNKQFQITLGMLFMIDYIDITFFNESTMSSGGYGSDFVPVRIGPLMMFEFPWNFYLQLFAHWKTDRSFTDNTVGNLDFTSRQYKEWYIYFERIAFIFGWKF